MLSYSRPTGDEATNKIDPRNHHRNLFVMLASLPQVIVKEEFTARVVLCFLNSAPE